MFVQFSLNHIAEFSNYDLDNVITPIKPAVLERLLKESSYDPVKSAYLVEGFTNGFDLHYQGPEFRQDRSENIPLRIGSKLEIWEKMMKEVKEGRYARPFKQIPFESYVQSPIGLVPKDGGTKTRLIFHLSYDFKKSRNKSLNYYIPDEMCSVKYNDIDEAIHCSSSGVVPVQSNRCFMVKQT